MIEKMATKDDERMCLTHHVDNLNDGEGGGERGGGGE